MLSPERMDPFEPDDDPSGGHDLPDDRAQRIARLFDEHNGALIAFLTCRLNSRADAQEVAQEVYVRMLSMDRGIRIESPKALMFRIAANLAVDGLRKQQVRQHAPADAEADDWTVAPVPEQHTDAMNQWAVVEEALRELPPKTSRAFVMHMIQGQAFDAVARSMNLSERMVRYHVSHALAYCRARCNRAEGQ
ncbi:RNA polymerase sigma-70 factor (ECF subfamily) [Luteibacter sp. Sphag1AF]|uniref:RNA polymerase sigma factor n=1 Tax=Luteibacter sp. Sphag1AF TaxID=2587031 RepID=UPI0017E6EDCC|nr:sigma-70 family RNA polymerase sigma factor [Luteibacter sp. Sphag1AF]MBB3225654.1 RNA polymerase sigma-70 factor (ECF subfamily) [Luteibacter sp. Sphag1AF]